MPCRSRQPRGGVRRTEMDSGPPEPGSAPKLTCWTGSVSIDLPGPPPEYEESRIARSEPQEVHGDDDGGSDRRHGRGRGFGPPDPVALRFSRRSEARTGDAR